MLRREKLCLSLKGNLDDSKEENNNNNNDTDEVSGGEDDSPTSPDAASGGGGGGSSGSRKKASSSSRSTKRPPVVHLDETVRQLNAELAKENRNLDSLVTSLHEKIHVLGLKNAEQADTIDARDLTIDDLKSRNDELEMELNRSRTREKRMEDHLYDAREKIRDMQSNGASSSSSASSGESSSGGKAGDANNSNLTNGKVEELKRDLEEQRELALSRLAELEALNTEHKETLKVMEKCRLDLQCIPDVVIRESAEYKSLQSHFSVLYNDSVQLKTQVEELNGQLSAQTAAHLRQIEQMESEELNIQKQLRTELMQMEEANSLMKKT